ncbi:hypothetical protein D3Z38_12980 [Clostridiales bacterium]|nr:hypothetical protein [Clostridiales bacterium]
MQITKLTPEQQSPVSYVKTFTTEELEQEYDYYMAQKLMEKMLGTGIISVAEFNKITAKNRQTFLPFLSEIMPKMT